MAAGTGTAEGISPLKASSRISMREPTPPVSNVRVSKSTLLTPLAAPTKPIRPEQNSQTVEGVGTALAVFL